MHRWTSVFGYRAAIASGKPFSPSTQAITSAGHEQGDADVVLQRALEIIVFDRAFLRQRALEPDAFIAAARSPTEHLLVEDPRLFERYVLRRVPTPVGVVHYLERIQ